MTRETYIRKYFTEISLNKDYLDLYCVRKNILEAIDGYIPSFRGVVLDVGCGIMPYKERILKKNSTVSSYMGLDFEQSLTSEYELGKPELYWKGDVIPLENSVVDTIIATEVFEHCSKPEDVMIEMLRVLKPGGLLFFTVPFIWNLHVVPYDEYRYTPFSLRRHLTNSGFIDLDLKPLGGWDASLAQMLGIWSQQRYLKPLYKKVLTPIIKVMIKRLMKADEEFKHQYLFREGCMITGIAGIGYKPSIKQPA
jgi:SAM-dependent methyltransferase